MPTRTFLLFAERFVLFFRYIHISMTFNCIARQRSIAVQRRILRINIASIGAFLLSWTPYCVVSLGSTLTGKSLLSPNLALIPEVLAKVSVVFNPVIYYTLNPPFRITLLYLLRCRSKTWTPRMQKISTVNSASTFQLRSIGLETLPTHFETSKASAEKSDSIKDGDTAL